MRRNARWLLRPTQAGSGEHVDISSQNNNLIDIAAWLQHMPVDTFEDGATIMFAMTVPPSVPQPDQVVLAQASNTRANQKFDYVLNACQEVEQEGAGRAR